jgi:RimJ/RimL family protein N-acetyltransferase
VAVVDARNERSLAVARRLEMRHEGQVYLYGADLELFALEDEGA